MKKAFLKNKFLKQTILLLSLLISGLCSAQHETSKWGIKNGNIVETRQVESTIKDSASWVDHMIYLKQQIVNIEEKISYNQAFRKELMRRRNALDSLGSVKGYKKNKL